ncbi:MAG: AbrB/MazE/SpoVT family DNA-binding domain-containing protein [SAR324 cluster bacterium]|nr:AbrB/MazE/SpoVT family DNA-binding domain-containing protein [SAR324 cluster bacterium]
MEAKIDQFGRIVIPKKIRETFKLNLGSFLEIEEHQEGILLKPIQAEPSLIWKKGVLVFTGKKAEKKNFGFGEFQTVNDDLSGSQGADTV